MSKVNNKLKIALIGPYPPPFGGISIHTKNAPLITRTNDRTHNIY
jgi:hypothetical protein